VFKQKIDKLQEGMRHREVFKAEKARALVNSGFDLRSNLPINHHSR
jgi:hypothetical protein